MLIKLAYRAHKFLRLEQARTIELLKREFFQFNLHFRWLISLALYNVIVITRGDEGWARKPSLECAVRAKLKREIKAKILIFYACWFCASDSLRLLSGCKNIFSAVCMSVYVWAKNCQIRLIITSIMHTGALQLQGKIFHRFLCRRAKSFPLESSDPSRVESSRGGKREKCKQKIRTE